VQTTNITAEERAELYLNDITRWFDDWDHKDMLPGAGPDHELDTMILLVSQDLEALLKNAESGDGTYWDRLEEGTPVPVMVLPGIPGDTWTTLMRGTASDLYGTLATTGWTPDRSRPEGLN
jgi:hypothetical protein